MANDNENVLRDNASFFAGAGFASDLLGAYYGSSQVRNQLKIRKEEKAISKILADAEFNRSMEALLLAQKDVKDKVTLELEAGRKEFRKRQAEQQVFSAERGQEGQSSVDIQNDLTRTHENFRQLQLINLDRAERDLLLKRQGIIDRQTVALLGQGISDPGTAAPFLSALSTSPLAAINAITSYAYYRGEIGSQPDFTTRSTD